MSLEPCPNCGKQISPEAAQCPKCGQPLTPEIWEKAKIKTGYKALAFIVITLLALFFLFKPEAPEHKAEKARRYAQQMCNDGGAAYIFSRGFVERQLKSPKSAEFPSSSQARTSLIGECRHQIFAFVDAQNSFGARVRTYFTAVMEYDKALDSWSIISTSLAFGNSMEEVVIAGSAALIRLDSTGKKAK